MVLGETMALARLAFPEGHHHHVGWLEIATQLLARVGNAKTPKEKALAADILQALGREVRENIDHWTPSDLAEYLRTTFGKNYRRTVDGLELPSVEAGQLFLEVFGFVCPYRVLLKFKPNPGWGIEVVIARWGDPGLTWGMPGLVWDGPAPEQLA
jgi:hypothetical protein